MKKNNINTKLVIAYGNPYRNDDGVGHYIASEIQKWADEEKIDKITIITAYQLDIDMTEDISFAESVFFLDAHIEEYSPELVINKIEAKKSNGFTTHVFTPSDLIALVNQLYNKDPSAMLISVPGYDFDMGEELTPETKKQADRATEKLKHFLTKSH
jgi:hydrogenase maturation protease